MQTGKPTWWDEAVAALSNDELLGDVVKKYPNGFLEGKGDLFQTTVRSIVGQQISVIASDAIWKRLVEMLGSVTPDNVMKFTQEEIAACGLTRPKSSYIHRLAVNSELLLNQDWEYMTDKEIKQHLIQFKGIGPWTAEMMLMFSFMRPDVFSIGDIGLVKAVKILAPQAESKESIEEIAERWSPYRTAASWYLWRMIDPVPVGY
ncbi:MAG: DNA-3-methyladenine glycosylase family protein [Candidatus Poseidoniaceae archaeon]